MKSTSYLHWTNAMLDTLNVSVNLNQQLSSLVPPDCIPDDSDDIFSECSTAIEDPSRTTRGNVLHVMSGMLPADGEVRRVLYVLLEHVLLRQWPVSFVDSDFDFWRCSPERFTWSMCAGTQKWSAVHGECITIEAAGSRNPHDLHCVCGRGYTCFIDPSEKNDPSLPSEGERKDEISKDVAMLFSQVAASIKSTNHIKDYEAFLWGLCDTSFYLVRGYFPASYIEAVEKCSSPLPNTILAQVDRTIFMPLTTPDGRREAVRGIMALLRYLELRHQRDEKV